MEHIVSFVESKGKSLTDDLKLDADEKSDLRAYFSLTENIFSHAEVFNICVKLMWKLIQDSKQLKISVVCQLDR